MLSGWRGKDYTNRSFTWTCEGKEKQREADEDLDGQCQEDLKEKNFYLTRINGEATTNREVWMSLIIVSSSAR